LQTVWDERISILVPVYNMRDYLSACVDSVLAQRDADVEVILVDDGSTDGSGALADEMACAHPDCVRVFHQENRGLIVARRQGVRLAAGGVCMFLDADDMLAEGSLRAIRDIGAAADADMVIFNYVNLYEATGMIEAEEPLFPSGSVFAGEDKKRIYEEIIGSWQLNNLCMKAIRTALVRADDTPYEQYAQLRFGEDLLQSLYPVTHAKRIAYCAESLYIYRHTRESMIGQGAPESDEIIMEKLRAHMGVWGMETPVGREYFAVRRLGDLLTMFWQYYRAAGTWRERRALLRQDWAARLSPDMRDAIRSPRLPFKKRMQLRAILSGNGTSLWLMERLGGRKIRRQYSE